MKENIPENRGAYTQNWDHHTIENIEKSSSFAMNQNHLHLHVNVTNTAGFDSINKSRIGSK